VEHAGSNKLSLDQIMTERINYIKQVKPPPIFHYKENGTQLSSTFDTNLPQDLEHKIRP